MTHSEAVNLLMNSQYYEQGYKQGVSDVLDKIRAEIESYIDKEKLAFGGQFDSALNLALKIVDKYKTKSEGIEE